MRLSIATVLLLALIVPICLSANFTYLSEAEYKKLSRQERTVYWGNLENELLNLQQRKADALVRDEQLQREIEELKQRLSQVDSEYDVVYNRIISGLNLTQGDIDAARRKIQEYQRNVRNWNQMSDSELWSSAKAIRQTIGEYNSFKNTNVGKAPDFRGDIIELDRNITTLEANLNRAKPKYYEDEYKVVRGDYLSKIAGYSFIYNDSSKWGIIYRANRDQIKDPNIIHMDQVLKIPRGLPDTWKVYRGESLWRIASYPEVYGKGTQWPLIYRENQDQIKNPDLIYPNQIIRIPRD